VRGWNAKDPIAAMHPADAVILDNWFPSAADVMLRKGSAEHATDIDGEVETVAAYRPESGTQELFGWAGDSAYDVSSAGAVGAAVLSSLTNARWQWVNFATSNDNFLLTVNGADEMRVYDGSTWTTINGGSTPSITNVDTDDLIGVFVHAERPFYIERNKLSLWYPAAGAFAGALTEFPMQGVFKDGGFLMAGGSWSLDAGNGLNSFLVAVTSEGEAAVYSGTDPADFVKVGVYKIGTPIGRRCIEQYGGDLLIITTDGVIPASKLANAKQDKTVAVTDGIQTAMAEAVALYGSTFGWEVAFFPGGNMLLLNVPIASGLQQQYVMNTVTRRWCRFRPKGNCPGWPANCFTVFNGELYFGTDGEVRKAWTGTNDMEEDIEAELLCAFNYFGNRNNEKHFKLVRPIISWDANPAQIRLGVDVEFQTRTPTSEITLPQSTAGIWDAGLWDEATWGGDARLQKQWYTATGTGFAAALHMEVESGLASVRLSSVDYVFEPGEIL